MNMELTAFGCDFDDWPGPSKRTPTTIQYDPELDGPIPIKADG